MSVRTRKMKKEKLRKVAHGKDYESLLSVFYRYNMFDSWEPNQFMEFVRLYRYFPCDSTGSAFVSSVQRDREQFCLDDVSERLKALVRSKRFLEKCGYYLPFGTTNIMYIVDSWNVMDLMKLVTFCQKSRDANSVLALIRSVQIFGHKIRFQEVKAAMGMIKIQKIMES
jgi:hypothetical protein